MWLGEKKNAYLTFNKIYLPVLLLKQGAPQVDILTVNVIRMVGSNKALVGGLDVEHSSLGALTLELGGHDVTGSKI